MTPPLDPQGNKNNAQAMRLRILNVLPAATYQMDQFLKLVDVVVGDLSETAAVEVGQQPRLHLNAAFVAKYCRRDEHLLMLILHELYHFILGHTRLFPRLTVAHNILFDVVINAMLCRQFREKPYVTFFEVINSATRFPGRLLRPPAGWLEGQPYFAPAASDKERQVMQLLYGERSATVTYHEIFELMKEEVEILWAYCPKNGRDGRPSRRRIKGGFVLLGDHFGENLSGIHDSVALQDELLKEILSRVTRRWPDDAQRILGRGAGGEPLNYILPQSRNPRAAFLHALKGLLAKAGVLHPGPGAPRAREQRMSSYAYSSVLPNWRDRQAFSRMVLYGVAPILYANKGQHPRPRWISQVAHIYVDVSGSMANALPWLVGALDPLQRRGACRLYAFSTVVDPIKPGALIGGLIKNTLGTNIHCVCDHILSFRKTETPRQVVLLTDGATGQPAQAEIDALKARHICIHAGVVEGGTHEDLALFAQSIEDLPAFQ